MEKLKAFFRKSKAFLDNASMSIGIIILCVIICLFVRYDSDIDNNANDYAPSEVKECVMTLKYDAAKCTLVNEIDKYIKGT